ncbi:MFS transporter [Bradyrhizobium sp. KB893862 SZCCT0404]|uniref:MFS transporter n=1 Tax=Bradyrhizobium sp. KB893862 SZCCT0404 TaxID=2807672 RepID=UPI001BA7F273|nr:MFS transporter [Bradyrhizobium sp. KB893862 SZCCT0404]MBR1175211.1 MFS transporter [Bradyrhizobium sp. KB893862 SZCCT0404]
MSDRKFARIQVRFVILALITMLLALSSGDRATLSIAGPSMSKALGISPVELGWMFSAFAWAYVLAQVPMGWITDKLGAKFTILVGLTLWSIVTFAMSGVGWLVHPFLTMLVLRFLLGVFESPVGPAAGRIIAAWFPSSERGIAGAIFNSAQYVSLVVFTPLMGYLDHRFGWEHIFSVMGVMGLAFAALWAVAYYPPADHPKISSEELEYVRAGGGLVDLGAAPVHTNGRVGPKWSDLAALFRSRMLVGIFLAQYGISSITWFFVSWFPSYLVKARGFSVLDASLIATVPAIAGFIGGVATGFFSDWLLTKSGSLTFARKTPITIGLLITTLIIGCNYTDSTTLVLVLMSAAFFGKGFGSLGWTVVADAAPKDVIGLTGGVFNAIGNTAGITTPVAIGYILAATGSFNGALLYVGLHGLLAIISYWVIVGPIQRMIIPEQAGVPSGTAVPAE